MIDAADLHEVHSDRQASVYRVDLPPDDALEAACLALLDDAERARAARFKVAEPRRQFVIVRAALRLLLARHTDRPAETLRFAPGAHGKPFLVENGEPARITFNVSHTTGRGLIAIGRAPLGVDIEPLARESDFDLVAKGVFTAAERAALAHRDHAGRRRLFFRLWTQKEALIKARGSGFAYAPRSFSLPDALIAGERRAMFTFPGETAAWLVTDLSDDVYAAALVQTDADLAPANPVRLPDLGPGA